MTIYLQTVSVRKKDSTRRDGFAIVGGRRLFCRDEFIIKLKDEMAYPEEYDMRTIKFHDAKSLPDGVSIVSLEQLQEDCEP